MFTNIVAVSNQLLIAGYPKKTYYKITKFTYKTEQVTRLNASLITMSGRLAPNES